jgi:hypothetical protein
MFNPVHASRVERRWYAVCCARGFAACGSPFPLGTWRESSCGATPAHPLRTRLHHTAGGKSAVSWEMGQRQQWAAFKVTSASSAARHLDAARCSGVCTHHRRRTFRDKRVVERHLNRIEREHASTGLRKGHGRRVGRWRAGDRQVVGEGLAARARRGTSMRRGAAACAHTTAAEHSEMKESWSDT